MVNCRPRKCRCRSNIERKRVLGRPRSEKTLVLNEEIGVDDTRCVRQGWSDRRDDEELVWSVEDGDPERDR